MNKSAPLHNGDADFPRLAARAPRPHPGGPAGPRGTSVSLSLSLSLSLSPSLSLSLALSLPSPARRALSQAGGDSAAAAGSAKDPQFGSPCLPASRDYRGERSPAGREGGQEHRGLLAAAARESRLNLVSARQGISCSPRQISRQAGASGRIRAG